MDQFAILAHLVEHRPEEAGVLGSSPRGCTNFRMLTANKINFSVKKAKQHPVYFALVV
jgi:hypothetical protein